MGLVPPVEIRAETYKQEIREAESIKYKLENKEHDIKDLRRALKEKSEELSEMNVRKDKAEKRLQAWSLRTILNSLCLSSNNQGGPTQFLHTMKTILFTLLNSRWSLKCAVPFQGSETMTNRVRVKKETKEFH